MKKYTNTIIIAALLLILFPFLGLPELWENLYVIILAFIIGSSILLLKHKSGVLNQQDEESTLQEYIQELKDRFKEQVPEPEKKNTRISDVSINND
ncbi:MAG: hypothetical protein MRY57_01210 [Candidatus Pacebacteria bacterium]|nr:hypothetical protein [Candidatus Paceibacterota bacterium]